jgi:hypothetical protein
LAIADVERPCFIIALAYKLAKAVNLIEDIANLNALVKPVENGGKYIHLFIALMIC